MIQPLLKYPDPRIRLISGNVRFFNESLEAIIEDMTDTMKAEGLEALTAIQIGIQYNVIVLKEGDRFAPYINARFLKEKGKAAAIERSPYYTFTAEVERYTSLTVVYEDVQGGMRSRDVEGDLARRFQHQLDYAYGSTFADRVPAAVKQQIDAYLEHGLVKDAKEQAAQQEGSCPTVFMRDRIKRLYRLLMLGVAFSLLAPLVGSSALNHMVRLFDKAAIPAVMVLIVAYFFYAEYEAKRYKQCTSCQTGNIIGTVLIALVQLGLLSITAYFIVLT